MFSTYNKSKITSIAHQGQEVFIELNNKSYQLKARILSNSTGELKAPDTGNMSRRIKESNDSEVEVTLTSNNGSVIFQETGKRAGLEIIEKIFDYL